MIIPENCIEYVKKEAKRVHHGKIIIEINETNDKIDVVTESRERFLKSRNNRMNNGRIIREKEFRNG